MAARGVSFYMHMYKAKQILSEIFARSKYNLAQMVFIHVSPPKIDRSKTWPPGGGVSFPIHYNEKT